jgi:trypsin
MLRIASFVCILSTAFIGHTLPALAGTSTAPVVGGTEVEPGTWPDVVAVLGEDGGLCTGTLLAADLVLTAGHCIGIRPVEVVIGSVDLARPGGERRAVKWSRAYPEWEQRYDVGVIMLEHPVFAKARAVVQACATRDRLTPGTAVQVVGFGLTTRTATDANTRLHQASLAIRDPRCTTDEACASAVAPGGEFIAGGGGVDACFGDSGGPVYLDTSHGPALVGVVSRGVASWGEPCGDGGIYVRADKVVAWIEKVSGRKVERVPCDLPADAAGEASEAAGCNAAGAVPSAFALLYAALVVVGLRRARRRAARR